MHDCSLELFGVKHRHHEVADENDGDEADNVGFHGGYRLERTTEAGVKRAEGEKRESRGDEDEVGHGSGACMQDVTSSPNSK